MSKFVLRFMEEGFASVTIGAIIFGCVYWVMGG